jgi:predicted metal-dependent peptidase
VIDENDKALRARLQLMLRYPFLASAVARLPLIKTSDDSWCQTAATDGYHIFWNTKFFGSLSEDEITGVLAHEVLHVVLGHIDRRGNRDTGLWNEAIDHATNLLLLDHGIVLPEPRLANYRFRNMPAEAIYGDLHLNSKAPALRVRRIGRGRKLARRSAAGSNPPSLHESEHSGFDIHIDPDDPRLGGLSASSRPSPLELGRLRHELMNDLRTELVRSLGPGRLPGELAEAIARAGRSKVPWQALLARCFTGMRRDDYRLLPPSRRHIWRGIYLPSIGVPGPRLVVCAIDTSGSVDRALARRFLAEVHGLRSTAQCRLHVVQCDTTITQVKTYESWEAPEPGLFPEELRGRGGTDFKPVFEWIREKVLPVDGYPDLLAYLTDADGQYPHKAPAYPVVGMLPERVNKIPPFCMKIEITL